MDAKSPVSITLLAEEWNIVLDVMSDGRHRIVAPIIQKIVEQAQATENALPTVAAKPNGHQPQEIPDARNLRQEEAR